MKLHHDFTAEKPSPVTFDAVDPSNVVIRCVSFDRRGRAQSRDLGTLAKFIAALRDDDE